MRGISESRHNLGATSLPQHPAWSVSSGTVSEQSTCTTLSGCPRFFSVAARFLLPAKGRSGSPLGRQKIPAKSAAGEQRLWPQNLRRANKGFGRKICGGRTKALAAKSAASEQRLWPQNLRRANKGFGRKICGERTKTLAKGLARSEAVGARVGGSFPEPTLSMQPEGRGPAPSVKVRRP